MYYVPYYVELYYANTECYIELSLTCAEAAGESVHTNFCCYLHYLHHCAVGFNFGRGIRNPRPHSMA